MAVPNVTTAVGRVMIACGERDDTSTFLPGATAQYTAILASVSGDEAAAYRLACGALAMLAAAEGEAVSSGSGKSISWRERIRLWQLAAAGQEPRYLFGDARGVAGSGSSAVSVGWEL
jgi:hypothetical protein